MHSIIEDLFHNFTIFLNITKGRKILEFSFLKLKITFNMPFNVHMVLSFLVYAMEKEILPQEQVAF